MLRLYFYGRKACLCSSSRSGSLLLSLPCCITQSRLALPVCTPSSLLQVIDGVMFLALYLHVVSQTPEHIRFPRSKPFVRAALPASVFSWLFPVTPACPGQYTHTSFRRWMSTINTFQSRHPIPLSTFCSKLIKSVRMMICVVRLSPLEAVQRRP